MRAARVDFLRRGAGLVVESEKERGREGVRERGREGERKCGKRDAGRERRETGRKGDKVPENARTI